MTFTVEDGTGIAGANALIDVAFADAYFALRGNTTWTGTDPEKEAKIVLATDYIHFVFGPVLRGTKGSEEQGLHYPLTTAEEVPEGIKKACAEYAVRAEQLAADPVQSNTGRQILSQTISAGEVSRSTTFAQGAASKRLTLPVPDMLMRPFINAGGAVIRA
jgi:hypothetical protein